MILLVGRSGGQHGHSAQLGPVDTTDLPPSAVAEIGNTLDTLDFFHLPSHLATTPVPDGYDYTLDVTDGDHAHSVSWNTHTDTARRGALQYIVDVLTTAGGRFIDWRHVDTRIDWDHAAYTPNTNGDTHLDITGSAYLTMDVRLRPEPVGSTPVDHHPIAVIGVPVNDIEYETPTPWQIVVDTRALPKGRKGIVLIGATKRQHFPH